MVALKVVWPLNGRTTCCTLCHCLCLHPANKTIQDTEYGHCFERIRSSVLALGDYNDVDGPSLKVFQYAFHALHVEDMTFAADFPSKQVL